MCDHQERDQAVMEELEHWRQRALDAAGSPQLSTLSATGAMNHRVPPGYHTTLELHGSRGCGGSLPIDDQVCPNRAAPHCFSVCHTYCA
jgi:hypothetical protein